MGQWIGFAQPSVRRQHGYTARVECGGDGAAVLNDGGVPESIRDRVRVLVHRQHRHPVRRVVCYSKPAVDLAHDVGERSAARHDEQPTVAGGVIDGEQHAQKVLEVSEQSTTNFYDDVDHRSNLQLEWSFSAFSI